MNNKQRNFLQTFDECDFFDFDFFCGGLAGC